MMMRKRPYRGHNRKEIRDDIMARNVQIRKQEIPEGWSIEAADFINRLIQRKPVDRLGTRSETEIISHPWLSGYPINKIMDKNLQAPYVPSVHLHMT